MNPYGYQDYAARQGSIPPTGATRAHEDAESRSFEASEDDEMNEEEGATDPLRLAVLRMLLGDQER